MKAAGAAARMTASLAGIKTPAEAITRPDAGFWLEQTLFHIER